MTFTYRPAGRLEDVLPQALAYARKLRGGQGQREDAVFTLNKVNIVVTHNSSLDHIFAAFVDTPEGGTVGPLQVQHLAQAVPSIGTPGESQLEPGRESGTAPHRAPQVARHQHSETPLTWGSKSPDAG